MRRIHIYDRAQRRTRRSHPRPKMCPRIRCSGQMRPPAGKRTSLQLEYEPASEPLHISSFTKATSLPAGIVLEVRSQGEGGESWFVTTLPGKHALAVAQRHPEAGSSHTTTLPSPQPLSRRILTLSISGANPHESTQAYIIKPL